MSASRRDRRSAQGAVQAVAEGATAVMDGTAVLTVRANEVAVCQYEHSHRSRVQQPSEQQHR